MLFETNFVFMLFALMLFGNSPTHIISTELKFTVEIRRLFIESKLNKSIQSVEIKISYSSRRKTPYQRLFSGYYLKRLAYSLYGSVASLPSPSSNIEAWPYGTSLRFASLLHLGH